MPSSPVSEQTSPEVAELEARCEQLEDRYKRALADLDNYRKRVARDIERRLDDGAEAFLRDFLEVVDSLERAARSDGAPEGLRAVLDQVESVLGRHGVTRLGTAGERFDPERHEAVAVRDTGAAPDQTVVEVARSGFARGDRILRPAEVVVARAPAGED
jgi:molecular chaperone GrpE